MFAEWGHVRKLHRDLAGSSPRMRRQRSRVRSSPRDPDAGVVRMAFHKETLDKDQKWWAGHVGTCGKSSPGPEIKGESTV